MGKESSLNRLFGVQGCQGFDEHISFICESCSQSSCLRQKGEEEECGAMKVLLELAAYAVNRHPLFFWEDFDRVVRVVFDR